MIIAIANQKGGVGKTTTAINLGAALHDEEPEAGVLLVDLDVTQRDLSEYSRQAGLNVLQAAAANLRRDIAREQKRLDAEYVLIDCPPALGKETGAALGIADLAIVPLQPEGPAVSGLARILQTIEAARSTRRGGNTGLTVKILLTMMDARDEAAQAIAADVRRRFGSQVFEAEVKRSPLFTQAGLARQTILEYSPRCHGSAGYRQIARELIHG